MTTGITPEIKDEKIKIDFFSEKNINDFIASPSEINSQKKLMDIMRVVTKFLSEPKKLKKILIGAALFLIVGMCSTIYFTIAYYNILIPIYIVLFVMAYIYGKRKTIIEHIKNIFTKKNN